MKENMCTAEEAYEQSVHAVEHVLFTEENGKTRLEREIESAFFKSIGRWLIGGGIVVILGLGGLYFQVQANSALINEGGRYTQEEADIDNANFQRQVDEMNKKLDIIIVQTRE